MNAAHEIARQAAPEGLDARALASRFAQVRAVTRSLVEPLSAEDCAIQSMPDASPAKWHLGHTTWFFETFVLEASQPERKPFHPAYRVLFNSYYEAVGPRHPRPRRGLLSRPGLAEVLAYRERIDMDVCEALETGRLDSQALALVELGLHHEQQHQELILTDVKHLLHANPLRPCYRPPQAGASSSAPAHQPRWLPFRGGEHEIGHAGTGFSFDNERPRHRVLLQDFEVASLPVTQGDFLRFLEDGGYRRPELWLSAGWDDIVAGGWEAPLYWEREGDRWMAFTLQGLAPLDPQAPVCHLGFFEAEAYARWAGARLPTEAEWEIATRAASRDGNFLETGALRPLPWRGTSSAAAPAQAFGDVWEWTRSDYAPYPGFRIAQGAVGEYNGKFMSGQYVLRGGSFATPRSHIRETYRNFFPPTARWQFSGLRLARDAA